MPNKELGIADPIYDALRIRSGQSIAPDLGGGTTGGSGLENKIQVWHADGSAIDLFDATETGLNSALSAATTGDAIWLPSINITLTAGIMLIAGVMLRGIDQSAIVSLTANNATDYAALIGPASGTAYISHLTITCTNAGSGDAVALDGGDGQISVHDSYLNGQSTGGAGYGVRAADGEITLDDCWIVGSTAPIAGTVPSESFGLGAEISTGSIPVTNSAGTTIGSLTIGNWYAVESFNGPWTKGGGFGNSYTYRLKNSDYPTWEPVYPGYIGYDFYDSTMHLVLPEWGAYIEAVDSYHARVYFQATTTSVDIRVGEDLVWTDNSGNLSWRLRAATHTIVNAGNVITHAVRMATVVGQPAQGDRSVWDALAYRERHTNDINDEAGIHHTLAALDARYSSPAGSTLDDLLDVNVPAPDDGDVLTWVDADALWEALPPATPPPSVTITHDDLSAACNGSDVQFSTSEAFAAGSTEVTLNGLLLRPGVGNSYVEDVGLASITLAVAPLTGDELLIAYVSSGTGAATLTISDVYIATTGSDVTGDGSSGNPYATLAKALSVLPDRLNSNCTIHIADGTYAEPINLQRFTSPPNVTLKIQGNGATPANVIFTGTVTVDGVTQIGMIRGVIHTEIEGVTFNGTANNGVVIRDRATAILDRCVITGTLSFRGLYVSHFSRGEIQGNLTVSGIGNMGIDVYEHGEISVMSAGTISVTGNGSSTWGVHVAYQSLFIVEFITGVNIEVYETLIGFQLGLHGAFQHYADTGTVKIDNVSTPGSSIAVQCTDLSTWSTKEALTIDHFTKGFEIGSLSYAEAIGSRTITNVGTTSTTNFGGQIYLP